MTGENSPSRPIPIISEENRKRREDAWNYLVKILRPHIEASATELARDILSEPITHEDVQRGKNAIRSGLLYLPVHSPLHIFFLPILIPLAAFEWCRLTLLDRRIGPVGMVIPPSKRQLKRFLRHLSDDWSTEFVNDWLEMLGMHAKKNGGTLTLTDLDDAMLPPNSDALLAESWDDLNFLRHDSPEKKDIMIKSLRGLRAELPVGKRLPESMITLLQIDHDIAVR